MKADVEVVTGLDAWVVLVTERHGKDVIEFYAHRKSIGKSGRVTLDAATLSPLTATGNQEAVEHLAAVAIPAWVQKHRPPQQEEP